MLLKQRPAGVSVRANSIPDLCEGFSSGNSLISVNIADVGRVLRRIRMGKRLQDSSRRPLQTQRMMKIVAARV